MNDSHAKQCVIYTEASNVCNLTCYLSHDLRHMRQKQMLVFKIWLELELVITIFINQPSPYRLERKLEIFERERQERQERLQKQQERKQREHDEYLRKQKVCTKKQLINYLI